MITAFSNGIFTAQADTLGAQLTSLRGPGGRELLWSGDPAYWREHAPVLFPIVGALRDNRTRIGGAWYQMARHGIAKLSQFQPLEAGEGQAAFRLASSPETRERYPFDFALTVAYTLREDGYVTAFTVENTGSQPMPYAIGGHPGFAIPVGGEGAFEDYTIRFEKEESQRCPAILDSGLIDPTRTGFVLEGREIPLRHDLFYQDALVFEGLRSSTVQVVDRAGHGVEMEFSQFPLLGIWSAKNDGPYVCLEPWTGCATQTTEGDVFQEKKGMALLAPGEKRTHAFTVRFL